MIRALCTSLLVVVLAAALRGEDQLIKVDVDLVNVYLTVANENGRLIKNLKRDNFTVFEDGAQQFITNFSRETDVPLTIALVIDTSGSVKDKLQFEKQAAISFLDAMLRPNHDKAAVFTFDSSIDLQQDFTDDSSRLAKAVIHTRAGGGTRLYDALTTVMQQKLTGNDERKVIVLLTDGDDNSSRSSVKQVVADAQRYGVTIYAISMNALGLRSDDSDRGDRILKMITSGTGGEAFFPAKIKDLPAQFKRITEELRSQYTIAYRSTNPKKDGAFRKIQIGVKNQRYSVRTRPGYYAPVAVAAR
jgi:Ca-activated chloride channel homolog